MKRLDIRIYLKNSALMLLLCILNAHMFDYTNVKFWIIVILTGIVSNPVISFKKRDDHE